MQGQRCQRSTSTRIPGSERKCRPSVAVATLSPNDFAGWFEAFLGGRFDPRNNMPRTGRVPIALGHAFGPNTLASFKVWSDKVSWSCQPLSGRTINSSGFYGLQSSGLGDPQPKNLLGLLDAAQLKMSERLQASVTASRSLSKLR